MKHIKTFESISIPIRYAILKDTYNIERSVEASSWHNLYGIIVDIAIKKGSTRYYLVRMLNNLNKEELHDLTRYQEGFENGKTLYNTKKTYRDLWVVDENVEIYNNKEEFDDAVLEIETKKRSDKYNL